MTREVVGLEPAPVAQPVPAVDFDLGELTHVQAREPIDVPGRRATANRLGRSPIRPWVALAVATGFGLVAAFAGWHVGADRRQSALDAVAVAHPGLFAWVVDGGPSLASAPDDPRVSVNLHLTNLGAEPVQIRSVSITTDQANATVALDGYQAVPIAPDDNTIAALIARPTCTSSYEGAFLSVVVTRLASDGSRRTVTVPAGNDGRIGDTLGDILDRVCVYPTRDDPASGVDGLVIDQSSGAAGATVTIANRSKGVRQVRVTSDDGPAFAIVGSRPDGIDMNPGDVVTLHLKVRVLDCAATYGLRDWASDVGLFVVRRGVSGQSSPATDVQTAFPLPDLMLVPGGAAIERACH